MRTERLMSSHGLIFDKQCAISRLHAFKLCITKAEQTAACSHVASCHSELHGSI
jgi:hypothetical protein